jgi:hypothetical protein
MSLAAVRDGIRPWFEPRVAGLRPRGVLLDIARARLNGIEAATQIRAVMPWQ